MCHEKRLKAVGPLARKGEISARGHRDTKRGEEGEESDSVKRLKTEARLTGWLLRRSPHRAVTRSIRLPFEARRPPKPARGLVTSST